MLAPWMQGAQWAGGGGADLKTAPQVHLRPQRHLRHFPVPSQPLVPHSGHQGEPVVHLYFALRFVVDVVQPPVHWRGPQAVSGGVKVSAVTAWPWLPRPLRGGGG